MEDATGQHLPGPGGSRHGPSPPWAGASSGLHRGKAPRREEAPTGLSRVCGFISSQKDAAKNSSLSLDDFTLNLLNFYVTSYYLLPAPAGLG